MKAYVLMAQMYEDVEIKGVFATREMAEAEMKRIGRLSDRVKIYYGLEIYETDDEMELYIEETEFYNGGDFYVGKN